MLINELLIQTIIDTVAGGQTLYDRKTRPPTAADPP
jgi:hypothetical protein